jgi:hypothetical protein
MGYLVALATGAQCAPGAPRHPPLSMGHQYRHRDRDRGALFGDQAFFVELTLELWYHQTIDRLAAVISVL